MMNERAANRGRWMGPAMGAGLAFILFAWTTATLPVPGDSARQLAEHLQLTPFPPMDRPLWGILLRGLVHAWPGSAWLLANGLSVVLGACCAGLLGRLVACSIPEDRLLKDRMPGLATAAGFAAALALATAAPFWLVSNRAHPATTGLFLFLAALNLLQNYRRGGGNSHLFAGIAVYALGLAELPSMLVFLPVLLVDLLLVLWQRRQLTVLRVLGLAGLGLLAPLVWVLSAARYAHLPAAEWREMAGFWDALRYQMIFYRDIILRSLPKQGWILLFFSCLFPWVVAFFVNRRRAVEQASWEVLLLMGLVTATLLALLANAPFSPWSMFGAAPLLVTPYVLIAAAFAWALVFWIQWLANRLAAGFRKLAPVYVVVMAVLVSSVALVRTGSQVSTRSAQPVQSLVNAMLDQLEGRDFLVSYGLLPEHLRLTIWQKHQTMTMVDLPLSEYSGYRRYMASLFPGTRQQSLALVGLPPLLVDWLATGSNAVDRLALQFGPDLWLSEGYQPLPMGTVYLGVRQVTAQDVERVRAVATSFWPRAESWIAEWQRTDPNQKLQAKAVAAHVARVANDTGVFFEHHGRREWAREAYAQARKMDLENLSAAANLVVLGQAAGWTGLDLEEADLALAVASREQSYTAVASRYGHLRRREAAQLVGPLNLPLDTTVEGDEGWNAAVSAYLRGQRAEARRLAEKLIAERPEFDSAWILLATLAYEQGDDAALQKCIRQMRTVRREWPEITLLLGRQALDRNDLTSAREFLERAAVLRPGNLAVLEQLLQLDLREREFRRAEMRVRQILGQQPSSIAGQLGLAVVLRAQQRDALAEEALQRVLAVQRHPLALSELSLLRMKVGQSEEALQLATEAVALDGRRASSHEALGLIHLNTGDGAAAVDDFRRALQMDESRVASRVYLACALKAAGRAQEFQELYRQLRKDQKKLDRELQFVLDQLRD